MIFAMPPLTKNNIKEIEEVFNRKLEPFAKATQLEFQKIDQRFEEVDQRFDKVDQKFDGFYEYAKSEFQRIDQRFVKIEITLDWIKNIAFKKLDDFMSKYKNHSQEILMLSSQGRRLDDRVTKLESQAS